MRVQQQLLAFLIRSSRELVSPCSVEWGCSSYPWQYAFAVCCVNSYSLVQLPDVIPGASRAAVSGSIEEAWYDSLAMSESDAEDDFHSVQDGKTDSIM